MRIVVFGLAGLALLVMAPGADAGNPPPPPGAWPPPGPITCQKWGLLWAKPEPPDQIDLRLSRIEALQATPGGLRDVEDDARKLRLSCDASYGLKQIQEALITCGKLADAFADSESDLLRSLALHGRIVKAQALADDRRESAALAELDQVTARRDSLGPLAEAELAAAHYETGILHRRSAKDTAAAAAYNTAIGLAGEFMSPRMKQIRVRSRSELAEIEARSGRSQTAAQTLGQVVADVEAADGPGLTEIAARAGLRRADLLIALKRPDEAVATLAETARRFAVVPQVATQHAALEALVRNGELLVKAKRPDEARTAFAEVVGRWGKECDGRFKKLVDRARAGLGKLRR